MYTKQYDPDTGNWDILDPQGDVVVNVLEEDADILLSHLNR